MATDTHLTMTLPGDDQILVTAELAVPPDRAYRAWTAPELVRLWWAGRDARTTDVHIDLRVGGRWRYAMEAGGGEIAFHGYFREIAPGERIVSTEVFEDPAGYARAGEELVNTVTFTGTVTGTLLTLLVRTRTRAQRDRIVVPGLADELRERMELLERAAAGPV
ncbi:SRPBCC domain-containing protein [Nocardiopsis sp. YSL2]|uniref:SRPBCC domain-containing protein n=1 Tax=Nocardiopsis sp. YSL2 TaxID=2939492 RepID=UPI0026F46325|nr:SRPBCC domain-containing protein [Nocardiopsis sp. YSL2]